MLEGLAAWVLNNYLGQYFENVHTDQLSVGLLNGEVELENLPLRKDALKKLELPLQVESGFVGKIRLEIPVTSLRSEPWIVIFEQLYLVVTPINLTEYDEKAEMNTAYSNKMSQLNNIESAWKARVIGPEVDQYESSYLNWASYGTSFVSNILENIQLKVKDVHIRYEDSQTLPNRSFSFGIKIDSLLLQSSDEHWVPKFIYLFGKEISYKLLELKNLVVYMDPSGNLFGKKSLAELAVAMHPVAYERNAVYIIEPMNCMACLKRNLSSSPLKSRSTPRFICDLKVEEFFLVLTNYQCELLFSTLQLYERLDKARTFRKWRPKCAVAGNAKKWWKFAIDCTLGRIRHKNQNRNWPFVLQRARDLCNYVDIYGDYLADPFSLDEQAGHFKISIEEELNFESLKYIRAFCMEKVAENVQKLSVRNKQSSKIDEENVSKGVLQSWFPTWSGWYTSTGELEIDMDSSINDEFPSPKTSTVGGYPASTSLEEEILYVISDSLDNNTYIKRDAVFCHVSFFLQRCTVTLRQNANFKSESSKANNSALYQLEFTNVRAGLESRPRNQAFKCDLELGSMSLKDHSTKNTAFPLLIASNQRENLLSAQKASMCKTASMYERLSSMISHVSRISQSSQSEKTPDAERLLSLTYERNPRNSKFNNKLVIQSQSIDVIYNRQAFDSIRYFFSKFNQIDENQEGLSWTEAAKKRYEEIKQQTKDELKRNWNAMFEKTLNSKKTKWDIQLDISAPQIIFPEHFEDVNATLVVVDLGKLVFSTSHCKNDPASFSDVTYESDNDTFATPCSTPDELLVKEELKRKSSQAESLEGSLSEANIHDHLYEKYDLKLCDIQVLVAKVKDNWRFSCAKGTGPTHVVERFSINLHVEKRLFDILPDCASMTEYQWPHFALSGTLPRLTVHINEIKVDALVHLVAALTSRPATDSSPNVYGRKDNESLMTKSNTLNEFHIIDEGDAPVEESELIIMQFAVDKLSVQLQARGISIAELQVTGVRTKVSQRPSDTTALLTVHSLLLVDALQTFGPDFELLIASNKHIGMDSVSGKLMDSDHCSPVSPSSPDPNFVNASNTSIYALTQALSNLASNRAQSPGSDRSSALSPPFIVSPTFAQQFACYDERDSEALISLEVVHIQESSLTGDNSQYIVSIQFNSLDVIANQETVVELVGFFHQMFSSITTNTAVKGGSPPPTNLKPSIPTKDIGQYGSFTSLFEDQKTDATKIKVMFDFHKLTVLLLRGVAKDGVIFGRKVATAVISDAKIELSVESDLLSVEGSLGGFQIRDVTPDGNKHQCLISMGHDPIVESSQGFRSHNGIYQPVSEFNKKYSEAFSFKVIRPLVMSTSINDFDGNSLNELTIQLRLASVCYAHSPQFLLELKSCATDFKQYMIKVAGSLKQAATDMAMGLVSKRIETFANLTSASREGTLRRQRTMSLNRSTDTLHFPNPPPASTLESQTLSPIHTLDPDLSFNVKLDIILETPVIVLPESPKSACVLVAHLGQISLRNHSKSVPHVSREEDLLESYPTRIAEFEMKIREISLYSLNIEDRLKSRDGRFSPLTTTLVYAQELYNCQDHGSPILHNTGLDLILTHQKNSLLLTEMESGFFFSTDAYFDQPPSEMRDSYQVEGRVVTPLKLSISRNQYHQIMKTLNNISIYQLNEECKNTNHQKLDPIDEVSQHEEKKHEQSLGESRSRKSAKNFIPLKVKFVVPNLRMELIGDENKPLVDFLLQDIVTTYEAKDPHKSDTQISLKSLSMEDMQLCENDSVHRFLMKSELIADTVVSEDHPFPKFISSSCPQHRIYNITEFSSTSLPSRLEMEQAFVPKNTSGPACSQGFPNFLKHKNDSTHSSRLVNITSPFTPPSSPVPKLEDSLLKKDALVTIMLQNIDERHPDFVSKYDGVNRFVDIDFNNLISVINIESWVMVLDFFKGNKDIDGIQCSDKHESPVTNYSVTKEETNVVVEISVNSLTIVFNEPGEELARASINHVSIRSVGSADNLNLTGKLGSLYLLDSTKDGQLYRNKFITKGREAITFQLVRYNLEDPELLRDCDIRLKLVMSSIMYIHSQKFTMRLIQFFNNFISVRDYVSDWRLISAGVQVSERKHGNRASLNITADAPIICVPMSSQSDKLLVLDLGSLSVSNMFHFAGSSSTISEVRRESLKDYFSHGTFTNRSRSSSLRSRSRSNKRPGKINSESSRKPQVTNCLLDVMQVQLTNMDLLVGIRSKYDPSSKSRKRATWKFGSFVVNRKGNSLLREKCAMKLQVERNLDWDKAKIVPDFSIHGLLTRVHASVDVFTYKLVKGLLIYNLGEAIPIPHSSPQLSSFLNRPKPPIEMPTESELWTTFSIDIELDNVTIEADNSHTTGGPDTANNLAKVDFINSRLSFKTYSNSSREIDLVSNEIKLTDIQPKNSKDTRSNNVFTEILLPGKDKGQENCLQAEVHYRFNKNGQICKILLNKMRLMVILEWWKEALTFLQASFPTPLEKTASYGICSVVPTDVIGGRPPSPVYFSPRLNPVMESTGLITRHSLISEISQPSFELNFNIIDSEVIIVENSSIRDSPALILKTTAILTYQPELKGQPVSCSLNHCELYSCVLGNEEVTALSIVDPVNVYITVNDLSKKALLSDISNIAYKDQHLIEVSFQQLNIRLSYHDMKMFQRILESIPEQTEQAMRKVSSVEQSNKTDELVKLSELGFSAEDCQKAMDECKHLDEAAIWLTKNAFPQPHKNISDGKKAVGIHIQNIELRTEAINFCIIDDCGDCDVPLLEASFSRLEVNQDLNGKGYAACKISVDYYNRSLSGWEPFIEPWRCNLNWHRQLTKFGQYKTAFQLVAVEVIDFTVTSTLIDLLRIVKRNWLEDYYGKERNDSRLVTHKRHRVSKVTRKRTPFVPFSIKNDTGCQIRFSTVLQKKTFADRDAIRKSISDNSWTVLQTGQTTSFSFQNKGKQRHGDTHDRNAHRLAVQVNGMEFVDPVAIDRVGAFFRIIGTPGKSLDKMVIVFSITMDGVARKLITVRSALLLRNLLPFSLDLKMDNNHVGEGGVYNIVVPSKSTISIPLMYTSAKLYIRPFLPETSIRSEYVQCSDAIQWKNIIQNFGCCQSMICDTVMTTKTPLRFFAYVKSDNYPQLCAESQNMEDIESMLQPSHTIFIVSEITLINLLPSDLHYEMNSPNMDSGLIKSGQNGNVSSVMSDSSEFEIRLWTDNFRSKSNISIRPDNSPYNIRVMLMDTNERQILIMVHVDRHHGKAVQISVHAQYWLINKTSLPLVFKQEGTFVEAAGQEREHEIAQCTAPLIFSFSDQEAMPTLLIRVGKRFQLDTKPQFCKMLPLTQGTMVRRLIVCAYDQKPDFVYIIGIDVRPGRGRYSRTCMVTFSPRFHIENNSRHRLLLAQKYFASVGMHDIRCNWLRATPGCSLPFHWPRLDMEPLLVVRMDDITDCLWSGGFLIEQANSFNLNIRNITGQSFFLHVEILLVDATFFTVISDAEFLPPPLRIDNYSEVPISYYQTGTREAVLRTSVKPRSSVPYAWDEITLPPYITCVAPGGTTSTYSLNCSEKGANLEYENFIYIAFSGTFPKAKTENISGRSDRNSSKGAKLVDPSAVDLQSASLEFLQLVLDVVEGSRVTLNRKQSSCRSQLWRMTTTGMLHHEGSSPPFDPNCKRPKDDTNILVLDIAGTVPLPLEYTALMLRKPDPRRRFTQTWSFTEDGQLRCKLPNLFVQAKDGFMGLQSGNEVVLGPPQRIQYGATAKNVPLEQAICRQRLRPGSGVLAVDVIADGPTRVLQITDVRDTKFPQILQTQDGEVVSMRNSDSNMYLMMNTPSKAEASQIEDYQIQMNLREGIGLSLIAAKEELFYARMAGIILEYVSCSTHKILDFSIRDIQVDNQLLNNQCQIVVCVTPPNKNDESRHLPALQFSAQLQNSPAHLNAYIFKNLLVNVKNLTLTIEEEQLCKYLAFCGYNQTDLELERTEEDQYDTRKLLLTATSANATRYYFSHLKVALDQVKLSVLTCKSLTNDLKNIRRKMGLTLIQFENAVISLNPFVRLHPFETWKFLFDSVKNHYEMELRSQAMRIMGSVDFLGNPIGLLSDVTEGVQEFVMEGSVRGLFMNVAHGVANSTAKMAESLSSVVGRVTMDKKHEAIRQRITSRQYGNGPDHLVSGVKGFGLGLYGGMTSLVSQTYLGASKDGFPGLFSGLAKGVIGTVMKPTSGILDLAIGTASAVRDTSKKPSLKTPLKIRLPRVTVGINGLTPRFNANNALGQQIFHMMKTSPGEIYHSYELILRDEDLQKVNKELKMLITSSKVYFFTKSSPNEGPSIVLQKSLSEIHHCRCMKMEDVPYIELVMNETCNSSKSFCPVPQSPKVQCNSQDVADKASKQLNHVKALHEELKYIVQEEK